MIFGEGKRIFLQGRRKWERNRRTIFQVTNISFFLQKIWKQKRGKCGKGKYTFLWWTKTTEKEKEENIWRRKMCFAHFACFTYSSHFAYFANLHILLFCTEE